MLNDFLITRDVIGFMQHFIASKGLRFPVFEGQLVELRQRQTVSYEQWWNLLEQLRSLHPVPALGLEIGRTVRIEDCGVLGYLFQTSRNLSEALSCFQRFQRLIYAGSLAHIERPSDQVLSVVWNPEQGYSSQDSDALLLTAMLAVSRQITHNPQLKPVRIEFTQPVAIDQQAAYQAYFGCDIRFCCPRLSISLAIADLLEPIPKSDQFLHQLLGQQAEFLLEKMPQHDVFMAALRDAFLRCLHDGHPEAASVAAEMQVSVRSLHRELAKRHRVFRDVLRDVRKSMAQCYLADESLSLTDIAMLLGYSEQSAFCRAFSSWFACSPLRWRQRRSGAAAVR
jgi:AraC-like DNA-binding protein